MDLVRSQTTNIPYRTCIHRYRELDVKNWNDGITHECLSDGASYIASCARTMEERKGGKKRGREESHEEHILTCTIHIMHVGALKNDTTNL